MPRSSKDLQEFYGGQVPVLPLSLWSSLARGTNGFYRARALDAGGLEGHPHGNDEVWWSDRDPRGGWTIASTCGYAVALRCLMFRLVASVEPSGKAHPLPDLCRLAEIVSAR